MLRQIFYCILILIIPVYAAKADVVLPVSGYGLLPGDILSVSVWKEEDLQNEVVVRPDGGISLPLIGDVMAAGLTIEALRKELTARYEEYIPDASVGVYLKQLLGNKIYVIGKVNHPGEFILNQYIDVVQALSKAGGLTVFAKTGEIKIIRRTGNGQQVYPFKYNEVEEGTHLEQNIILRSGDIILVP
jgi:polysaccharide export outer membrane protein